MWEFGHLRGAFADDRERAWAGLVVGRGLVLETHKPRDRRVCRGQLFEEARFGIVKDCVLRN